MAEHLEVQTGDVLRFCQHSGKAACREDELPGGAFLLRKVCRQVADGRWLTVAVEGPVDPLLVTQACIDRFAKKLMSGPAREEQAG